MKTRVIMRSEKQLDSRQLNSSALFEKEEEEKKEDKQTVFNLVIFLFKK